MRGVAIAHFAAGSVLTFWFGVRNIISPDRLYKYTDYQNEFLAQYGFGITMTILGLMVLVLGLISLRSQRETPPGSTVFIWETPPILAYVMGVPLLVFGLFPVAALVPYTAQRGLVFGQLLAAFVLVAIFVGGGLFFLHYRRTTILDPTMRELRIEFGKPFVLITKRFPFDSFQFIATEITYGKRGARFFRSVATGEGQKKTLIAVTMVEAQGAQNLKAIAEVTGWEKLDAAL